MLTEILQGKKKLGFLFFFLIPKRYGVNKEGPVNSTREGDSKSAAHIE